MSVHSFVGWSSLHIGLTVTCQVIRRLLLAQVCRQPAGTFYAVVILVVDNVTRDRRLRVLSKYTRADSKRCECAITRGVRTGGAGSLTAPQLLGRWSSAPHILSTWRRGLSPEIPCMPCDLQITIDLVSFTKHTLQLL